MSDHRDLWHLRHWLQYWQLRTWIHDNLCCLTINCDTGQHSQFLRCFFNPSLFEIFSKHSSSYNCAHVTLTFVYFIVSILDIFPQWHKEGNFSPRSKVSWKWFLVLAIFWIYCDQSNIPESLLVINILSGLFSAAVGVPEFKEHFPWYSSKVSKEILAL